MTSTPAAGSAARRPGRLILILALLAPLAHAATAPRFELLFSDAFDGSSLNTKAWVTEAGDGSALRYKGWLDGEKQVYSPSNALTVGGQLRLRATQSPAGIVSGRVRSRQSWMPSPNAGQYNVIRFEARYRVQPGSGLRARFFLLPVPRPGAMCVGCGLYGPWPASGEVDVLDVSNDMVDVKGGARFGGVGPNVRSVGATWHYDGAANATGWHTIALEWEPTKMTWYMDGQPRYRLVSGKGTQAGWFTAASRTSPNAPFDRPFYLGMALSAGGITAGDHSLQQLRASLGAVGKAFQVDFVRVLGKKVPGGLPVRPSSAAASGAVQSAAAVGTPQFVAKDWTLAWSDEFNGNGVAGKDWEPLLGNGRTPDNYGTGAGWGNKEEQVYTDNRTNVDVVKHKFDALGDPAAPSNDGFLKITARSEGGAITSARVRTAVDRLAWQPTDKASVLRVSARVKLPAGTGLWGMMWMLPSGAACSATSSGCGKYGGWPASGEVDILSAINSMATVQANQHYGGQFPTDVHVESNVNNPSGKSFAGEWHTFALEWSLDGSMTWKLDDDTSKGTTYFFAQSGEGTPLGWYTRGTGGAILPGDAPFAGQPFHLVFNLAVGGVHVGADRAACLETLKTPKYMMVDWVRVYTKK